jgi:hypothetical protein
MNWKLVFQLSLFGLAMALGTVFFIPSSIEPLCWLIIFLVCAYILQSIHWYSSQGGGHDQIYADAGVAAVDDGFDGSRHRHRVWGHHRHAVHGGGQAR